MDLTKLNTDDTIAAISTPLGEGGIGIVRISGPDALAIADKIFVSKDKKRPSEFKTYTMHYGWVVDVQKTEDRGQKSEIIDEVILTVMRATRSYTKEDVVEINCHGGIVALRRVLELVTARGARLAEPGEFTKRAFLNGRIDLAQAEAVLDLIRAKTEAGLRVGMNQLRGELSGEIRYMRDALADLLAELEASIDFPEEDIEPLDYNEIAQRLQALAEKLARLIRGADAGIILKEGITTVICGRPNVGKSSILNRLLKAERAIVTAIPGTTRDTIEEVVNIKGIPLRIVDTAGIRAAQNIIEDEGIRRSRQYVNGADLVLFVLDTSEPLKEEDRAIISELEEKEAIAVFNKIDLPRKLADAGLKERLSNRKCVSISAKTGEGIASLEAAIANKVLNGTIISSDEAMVTSVRHKAALVNSLERIKDAQASMAQGMSSEFAASDLRGALDALGEITGETTSEDILNRIFEKFCIGK